jgi:hypothetical protein
MSVLEEGGRMRESARRLVDFLYRQDVLQRKRSLSTLSSIPSKAATARKENDVPPPRSSPAPRDPERRSSSPSYARCSTPSRHLEEYGGLSNRGPGGGGGGGGALWCGCGKGVRASEEVLGVVRASSWGCWRRK